MKNIRVDLFKINKIKKEMVLIKEPFENDLTLKVDDNELNRIYEKYSHFLYEEDESIAVFGQDVLNEDSTSYHLRNEFINEFGHKKGGF